MDKQNELLQKIMLKSLPDMSHIKPPTESAASKMIANLRAAAGTKADHTPKN